MYMHAWLLLKKYKVCVLIGLPLFLSDLIQPSVRLSLDCCQGTEEVSTVGGKL